MTAANFPNVLPFTLKYEGKKSTVRADPGNWTGGKVGKGVLKGTNMGISALAYPNLDIMNLTLTEVSQIYERDYWRKSGADAQPNGLDLQVFDTAVNAGVGRAKGFLVKAKLQPTLTAQITAFADARMAFWHGLSTFRTFGKGWTARGAACEAASLRMASAAAAVAAAHVDNKPVEKPVVQAAVVADLKKAAEDQAEKQRAKTKAAVAAPAAGGAASAAASKTEHHTAAIVTIVIMAVAVAAFVGVIAWRHSVRSKAMLAEAAK